MHVSDISQIVLPPRLGADALLPAMDEVQYSRHGGTGEGWGTFGESTDELVQEFLGRDLEMERVST